MSQETTNRAWLELFRNTMIHGERIEVRGSEIKELRNKSLTIDPLYPFITYKARNYNFPYCKKELQWKVYGDKYDIRIMNHAKMWASVQNADGSFNSNYGHYWFKMDGIENAAKQLLADKHTRRAAIPMLAAEHIEMDVIDSVCTECMTFLIRKDKLHCIVHMRSSDQVFGLGTDMPSFSFVMRIMLGRISEAYPEAVLGDLTITAASSHVYERHYELYDKLDMERPEVVPMNNQQWMPLCDKVESEYLMNMQFSNLRIGFKELKPLTNWLLSDGDL